MQLSRFLNELEEMAYITDVQTDELVFINTTGETLLQRTEGDYKGKLCYQVLYGRKEPCEECPRQRLRENSYYVRKEQRALDGRSCTKKDKLVLYEDRLCQLEIQQFKNEERKHSNHRDKLTNLLTITEGKYLVESYLQNENENGGFLFLFDLDHFRKLNELYGYFFGDVVLKEFGDVILNQVSEEDIVARYEGDTILVFRKHIWAKEAYAFGREICEKVKNLYRDEYQEGLLSCSVGMMDAEVLEDYDGLVKYAEQALQIVKQGKRGGVLSYMDIDIKEPMPEKEKKKGTDSFEKQLCPREREILNFSRNILEKSRSFKNAVCILLAKIGREYGLTRIAIMEQDYDFLCYNVLFQWRASEQEILFPDVIYMEEDRQKFFYGLLEEDGYCCLNSRVDGIEKREFDQKFQQRMQLFCELDNQESCVGMAIFECEDQGQEWTQGVCEMLRKVSNMIAVYRRREAMNRDQKERAEFLSGFSHEIRTPMNAINGWTSIAKHCTDNKVKIEECLDKIDTSSRYLMSVMDELLDVENMEHGAIALDNEDFSIEEMFREMEYMFCRQLEKQDITCYFVNSCQRDCFFGDRKHIQKMLVHLFSYVTKNTESNASATLHCMETENGKISFVIESIGNYEKISEVKKVFEFLEEDGDIFNESIGDVDFELLVSLRYAHNLGGNVEFYRNESAWDICIVLPIEYREKVDISQQKESYDFAGKHLLLVEDNDLNVEVAQTLLEMVGFEVDVAENGKVAVEKFDEKEPGSYDAILMDIRMPIMDGLEATRRIRNLGKKDSRTISIVALSANAHDEDAKRSIASGMNGHLAKPIEVDTLYSMLQQLLR